ncbi:MFS transporter [uncultured Pseudokineococcus sp.]|uniref:MFS transporter n=1 Tax=uncultured Pseudokineococcus sp. TaxID=1642928 RepID=UPI0026386493|nr:MFS transporter [uncultured Pseudokineococcus sp.]
MSATFRSLHIRNYRIWAAGALVSNVGTWMQRVAQDWLVLQVLTAGSGVAVGITTGLQFLPMLLLGPYAGVVADRFDKRKLLMWTQGLSGLWGLVLGLLVVTQQAELWHVYALATLLGLTTAFDAPARQTFVAALVPPDHLGNAIGLNSASFNGARLIGPGVAGLLIAAFGTGPVFLINAVSFAATVVAVGCLRTSELHSFPAARKGKGQVREGLRYVRRRPDVVVILVVIGTVGTLGMNYQLTTGLVATQVFDKGATEYGVLGSILAIGSLSGALLAARRDVPRLRLVFGAAGAFGVASLVAASMPTYTSFALSLIPVGLSSLTMMTAANTYVQSTTDPAMRGRVMALYMMIFMGGTPIGSPLIGLVGDVFGARWTIYVGGISALVAVAGAVLWVQRRDHLRIRYSLREQPHLQVLHPDEGAAARESLDAAGGRASRSAA